MSDRKETEKEENWFIKKQKKYWKWRIGKYFTSLICGGLILILLFFLILSSLGD